MIGTKNWKLVVPMLAILTLTLTVGAWARGLPRGGHGGPGGPDGPGGPGDMHAVLHFGPLIEQLIFPCRNDCTQADRSCDETAESATLSCAAQACNTTIASAQTDCAANRASQACLTDVSTLITCVQPCLATESTAVTACATTFQGCVSACSPTPTPTPVP